MNQRHKFPTLKSKLARDELRVGDHISAKYPNGNYYGATIAEICGDGSAVVSWDDKDTRHRKVQRSDLKL